MRVAPPVIGSEKSTAALPTEIDMERRGRWARREGGAREVNERGGRSGVVVMRVGWDVAEKVRGGDRMKAMVVEGGRCGRGGLCLAGGIDLLKEKKGWWFGDESGEMEHVNEVHNYI